MYVENNTDSLLNAKGDVFNARGDVFNSVGDVFAATGDVYDATGDVFNSNGDFFNSSGPSGTPGSDEWLAYYDTNPFDSQYYAWLDGGASEPVKKSSFLDKILQFVGIADQGADVYNKIKSGTVTQEGAVNYETQLGEQPQADNTMWYIAGGAIVLLVVIAVVVMKNKKK